MQEGQDLLQWPGELRGEFMDGEGACLEDGAGVAVEWAEGEVLPGASEPGGLRHPPGRVEGKPSSADEASNETLPRFLGAEQD